MRDSNPRHSACKADATTAVLTPLTIQPIGVEPTLYRSLVYCLSQLGYGCFNQSYFGPPFGPPFGGSGRIGFSVGGPDGRLPFGP